MTILPTGPHLNSKPDKKSRYPLNQIFIHAFLLSLSLLFIVPLLLVVSASLTSEAALARGPRRPADQRKRLRLGGRSR